MSVHTGSLQHYPFTIVKNCNQVKCLFTDELRKCGTLSAIEYYTAMNKEQNPVIYDNLD